LPALVLHWSGVRPTRHSRSAGVTRRGGKTWLRSLCGSRWLAVAGTSDRRLGLVGAAFGIVLAQRGQISQLPEVMAMTMLALAGWPLSWRRGCTVRVRPSTRRGRAGAGRCPRRYGRPSCMTRCCKRWP
jgi:hypothetical protein